LEFFAGCRHLHLSPGLANLGAPSRFCGTCRQVQAVTNHVVCDPVHVVGVCLEFPAESVRALLPGTSIWVGDTKFRPLGWRTTGVYRPSSDYWEVLRADLCFLQLCFVEVTTLLLCDVMTCSMLIFLYSIRV